MKHELSLPIPISVSSHIQKAVSKLPKSPRYVSTTPDLDTQTNPIKLKEELQHYKETKPLPRWGWLDAKLYMSYQKCTSDEIETGFQTYLTAGGAALVKIGLVMIDFHKMTSTILKSNKEKTIVRGTWFYYSDEECYMAYEEEVALRLEALLQTGQFDEVEVSVKPKRVVKYIGNGNFRQYRHSKNAKKEGRLATRGWMGFMIKDGKEFQYLNMPKALLDPPSTQIISNKPDNFQELIKSGLYPFDHRDIFRDTPALARGSYGIVYKGKVKPFGERIVVIKDMFIRDSKSVIDWSRELETMQKSKSQYVAEVYGFTSIDNNLIIVMEYFPNGDLFNLLHKKKIHLEPLRRIIMARQILFGLDLLHENGILHRDIKSMNILVTQYFDCKITDFGMSKLISDDLEVFNTANAGTPLWMAPEVKAGCYGFPADVYSTGLVIFEILEQKLPPWDKLLDRVSLPEKYDYQPVISPLISHSDKERLTAKEAKEHFDSCLVRGVVDKIHKAYEITSSGPLEFDLLKDLEKELSKNPPPGDLFLIDK